MGLEETMSYRDRTASVEEQLARLREEIASTERAMTPVRWSLVRTKSAVDDLRAELYRARADVLDEQLRLTAALHRALVDALTAARAATRLPDRVSDPKRPPNDGLSAHLEFKQYIEERLALLGLRRWLYRWGATSYTMGASSRQARSMLRRTVTIHGR